MAGTILLDANITILFVVGLTNPAYIAKHKRLQDFDVTDFEVIRSLVRQYSNVVFTPNVLTETSNLIRHVSDPIRSEISEALARLIQISEEQVINSSDAVTRAEYVRLGLTDSVILALISKGYSLLTADLDLYLAAQAISTKVMNYNHIREQRNDFG